MDYRNETEEEHRRRDAQTWSALLLLSWLFPGLRWILVPFVIAVAAIWAMNVLGETGALVRDRPDVIHYYGNVDANGKYYVTKGCKADRILPDGSCDREIHLDDVQKSFPFLGPARQVPVGK